MAKHRDNSISWPALGYSISTPQTFTSSFGPESCWQLICKRFPAKTHESFSESPLPKSSFPICSPPSLFLDK